MLPLDQSLGIHVLLDPKIPGVFFNLSFCLRLIEKRDYRNQKQLIRILPVIYKGYWYTIADINANLQTSKCKIGVISTPFRCWHGAGTRRWKWNLKGQSAMWFFFLFFFFFYYIVVACDLVFNVLCTYRIVKLLFPTLTLKHHLDTLHC